MKSTMSVTARLTSGSSPVRSSILKDISAMRLPTSRSICPVFLARPATVRSKSAPACTLLMRGGSVIVLPPHSKTAAWLCQCCFFSTQDAGTHELSMSLRAMMYSLIISLISRAIETLPQAARRTDNLLRRKL